MTAHLVAVDLGLRTGLALFADDGRLVRYRSQHFGTRAQLERAAWRELAGVEGLAAVAVEGDAALARVWAKVADKRGARVLAVHAPAWRSELLLAREQRTGADAKAAAARLAREVVAASGLPRPTALRHDAAEAICIGLWACRALGWPPIR